MVTDHGSPPRQPPDSEDLPTGSSVGNVGRAGAYAGLGVQFVVAILLFLYAGRWLDGKLHTAPLFLIIGVFGGAAAGFYSMYRRLVADQKADEEAARRREDASHRG